MIAKQKVLDFFTIQNEIENNIIKPIYLIYGEGDYFHNLIIKKFKSYFSSIEQKVNYEIFYGENLDFGQLVNSIKTLPFGMERQCIIIKQLERVKNSLSQKLNYLLDTLSWQQDNLLILLCTNEKKIPQNINTKKIVQFGQIIFLPKPTISQTKKLIKTLCQKAHKEISEEAVYCLQGLTENNFVQISNELEKLFCFLSNSTNKINKDDIIKNLYGLQEGNIFDLVDRVGERKTREALFILRKLIEYGEYHPLQILAMLNRQIRLIFKAKLYPNQIKKNKGDKNLPLFVIEKIITQSQKYSLDELKKIFHYLLDAEINLKSSSLSPDIVLEQLIVQITKGNNFKSFIHFE